MDANIDFIIKLVAVIVAVSGWFKVGYDHYVAKPKIEGKLIGHVSASFSPEGKEPKALFYIYPYLINSGKSAVHILDYRLHVKFKGEPWIKLLRLYGPLPGDLGLGISPSKKNGIKFNDPASSILYKKNSLLVYGAPLHGWAPFVGDISMFGKVVEQYKFICEDAFGKNHSFIYNVSSGQNLLLLMEIADLTFGDELLAKHSGY